MPEISIHNVYQVTRNMDRALEFYRDVIGLDVQFRDGEKWSQLMAGNTKLALASIQEAAPSDRGSVVVFKVDDLDQARNSIEASGTEVVADRDMGDRGRVISCLDPDGNLIQLYQSA